MTLKFDEVKILDWYDNIINAFCKTTNEKYYCGLLAMNLDKEDKIYVCISLEFFKKHKEIDEIISSNTYKENWDKFSKILTKVYPENKSYLIKTKDLTSNKFEIIQYKANFKWPRNVLFYDYPYVLDNAKKIDNWWNYFAS